MTSRQLDSPLEQRLEKEFQKYRLVYQKQVPVYGEKLYRNENGVYKKIDDYPKYILDFVLFGKKAKVVVEADGQQHDETNQKKWDTARDYWLITHGYDDVLRFNYHDIMQDINTTIKKVQDSLDSFDQVYNHQEEKKNFDPNKIPETLPRERLNTLMLELMPLIQNALKENCPQSKHKPMGRRGFLESISKVLRKHHFNLDYSLLHFNFGLWLQEMKDEKGLFFSAYNLPFYLQVLQSPLSRSRPSSTLAKDPRLIKLWILPNEAKPKAIENWNRYTKINYCLISPSLRRIVYSDIQDQTLNLVLLQREAQELERRLFRRYKRKETARKLQESLREVYRQLYQHPEKKKGIILFEKISDRDLLKSELYNYWRRTGNRHSLDPFLTACKWCRIRGIKWVTNKDFKFEDVVLYFSLLKKHDFSPQR
ncbi:endonuclease domain-containing protein [Desmospora activa]|uniref:Uncharacterized protein DUF559 n=1 Tax=Desmospora activa DSM 45169 TaxID=1121389 RepID=A0A2T4YY93_9BACL|nr:DUF559 domain-containing protein [Desmospora activa]PTM51715.1 uncharacterized protein DUF559 [Desmospora activa DSM 45169]